MNRKARVIRCYTGQSLNPASELELDKRSSHHLSTVLRARSGTVVELFNGDGHNYASEVLAPGKKTRVAVHSVSACHTESTLRITLVQSIARGDKMDGIIQKATELGVSTIQPIYTKQSIARLDNKREEKKVAHWQAISISACEQCGRCVLPILENPQSLNDYLTTLDTSDTQRFILSPTAQASNLSAMQLSDIALLVGPESGFDEDELAASKTAGFTELQLGPRVLRTETAGPAAIAIMQARSGDIVI